MPFIEGMYEAEWRGIKYWKGDQGSVALINPHDPRPSRQFFIGKVPEDESVQLKITEFFT